MCGFTLAAAPAAAGEPADDDVAGFGRTADAAGRQYLDALNNFGRSFGFFTVIVDTATAVYEGYEGIKKLKE